MTTPNDGCEVSRYLLTIVKLLAAAAAAAAVVVVSFRLLLLSLLLSLLSLLLSSSLLLLLGFSYVNGRYLSLCHFGSSKNEGLPGVLGNKGTLAKYRREQGNISQFLGTGEESSKNYSTKTFGKCVGTWEHRTILEGNKGTRTPLGDPQKLT